MKVNLAIVLTIGVVLAVLVAGCTTKSQIGSAPTSEARQIIPIGALVDLTGESSSEGDATLAALEMAAEDMNSLLEEIGSSRHVALMVEDSGTDPDRALRALTTLSQSGCRVVIAATTSSELTALKKYADDTGIILIGTKSTAPSLAVQGDSILRLVADDTNQGYAMAQVLQIENISTIVPITRGDIWGDDLLNATTTSFKKEGGTVLDGVRYTPGTNFSAEVKVLSAIVQDVKSRYGSVNVGVYFISLDEADSLLLLAAGEPELTSVSWFGSDGTAERESLTSNRTLAQFAVRTHLICPAYGVPWMVKQTDEYQQVAQDLKRETGSDPTGYIPTSYDAVGVVSQALLLSEAADSTDLQTLLTYTLNHYNGITYHLSLNDAGDRELACYDLVTITEQNGTYSWQLMGQFISWDTGDDEMIWNGAIIPLG
jgi:branched-chain amino acid transport system substrate-binding protein